MKIVPIKERKRMSVIILDDIIDRVQEMAIKAEKKTLNDAYFIAWKIGILSDIENSLKKLKIEKVK